MAPKHFRSASEAFRDAKVVVRLWVIAEGCPFGVARPHSVEGRALMGVGNGRVVESEVGWAESPEKTGTACSRISLNCCRENRSKVHGLVAHPVGRIVVGGGVPFWPSW